MAATDNGGGQRRSQLRAAADSHRALTTQRRRPAAVPSPLPRPGPVVPQSAAPGTPPSRSAPRPLRLTTDMEKRRRRALLRRAAFKSYHKRHYTPTARKETIHRKSATCTPRRLLLAACFPLAYFIAHSKAPALEQYACRRFSTSLGPLGGAVFSRRSFVDARHIRQLRLRLVSVVSPP